MDRYDNEYGFRDPGGRSALRIGKRIHSCPTCGRKNVLSQKDKDSVISVTDALMQPKVTTPGNTNHRGGGVDWASPATPMTPPYERDE